METPLKIRRRERGLTQVAVAEAVGIQQSFYSKVENGEASASLENAAKLANFLDLTELEVLYPERYTSTGKDEAA